MLRSRLPATRILLPATLLVTLLATSSCAGPAPDPLPGPSSPSTASPTPAASPPPASPAPTPLPSTDPGVWVSWAVFDRTTGHTLQGGGAGTTGTESMIKVAIAAQYIRDLEQSGRGPTVDELHKMSIMIRDSDNDAAEWLYRQGGRDKQLQAVVQRCGLQHTTTKPGWWSETQITAADAAGLGACIANGRICSADWVTWLLGEMRSVRGVGRFGIIDVRPDDGGTPLAIKNGYQTRGDEWHVNCLAVADFWTMAILTRYPIEYRDANGNRQTRGIEYGAQLCADFAAALLPPQPGATIIPPGRTT